MLNYIRSKRSLRPVRLLLLHAKAVPPQYREKAAKGSVAILLCLFILAPFGSAVVSVFFNGIIAISTLIAAIAAREALKWNRAQTQRPQIEKEIERLQCIQTAVRKMQSKLHELETECDSRLKANIYGQPQFSSETEASEYYARNLPGIFKNTISEFELNIPALRRIGFVAPAIGGGYTLILKNDAINKLQRNEIHIELMGNISDVVITIRTEITRLENRLRETLSM